MSSLLLTIESDICDVCGAESEDFDYYNDVIICHKCNNGGA